MFAILLLLFTVIPAIEIFLFIEIGARIGAFETFIIVMTTGVVGAALAKSEGFSILSKLQSQLQSGQMPADTIVQGLMIFAGGLLLITPGFLTDIVGLCMVFPGTRHLLLIFVKKHINKAMQSGHVHFYTSGFSYRSSQSNNRPQDFKANTFEADFEKIDEPAKIDDE